MTDAPCLTEVSVAEAYSTSRADLLTEFMVPLLSRSHTYDRAVGYFSSALLALIPAAFAEHIGHGGAIRIVCSPNISATDRRSLLNSEDRTGTREAAVAALREMAEADPESEALIRAMSSLLAARVLQLKFARHGPSGLFHDKVGIFRDECGHAVSFVGSANETAAAWSGAANHEQIEAFASWKSIEQGERADRHSRYFAELWYDLIRGVEVSPATAAEAVVREAFPPEDLATALERVRNAHGAGARTTSGTSHHKRTLRPHQRDVLASWESSRNRGIIAFATGGGKTLAALEAIRRWTVTGRPALVLVPSRLLHGQWRREIASEIPDALVVTAGAGSPRVSWERTLAAATSVDPEEDRRIILATYQTAAKPAFLRRVRCGEHLLVVADEVHRIGARDTRSLLSLQAGGRLGLSATPERFGDPEGTQAIVEYFGETLEPQFGIREAIAAKQLVPYDYFLDTIPLDDTEMADWERLTRDIAREVARADGKLTESALYLLRRRARILKSASAKAPHAARLLAENFRPNDRWLVYCESRDHLRQVRSAIEHLDFPILEYHSGNQDVGTEVLSHFARGGVLLAIKCLDEGIDLPYINRALILASSANPREYIQRRGRVLRRAENKTFAQVFDVAVVGPDDRLLSVAEARRAEEFARDAENLAGLHRVQALLRGLKIDGQFEDSFAYEEDRGEND